MTRTEGGGEHARDQDRRQGSVDPLDPRALRAVLSTSDARFERARARVAAWLAARGGWVAWSGGKDSTVVADLAVRCQPDVPIVHFDSGLDYPDHTEWMQRFGAEQGWNVHHLRVGDGLASMVENGSWDNEAEEGDDTHWWVTVAGPHDEAVRQFGPVMMIGLRADESAKRKAILRRTTIVTLGNGTISNAVIAWWSHRDVWAYHASRGMGHSPVYDTLERLGVPERHRRVGAAVGSDAIQYGRAVWLRRGWPDLWQQYCAVLPRLKGFG